ncbi:STAS domain-containing protein [Streptomyces sp. BA2]|uniref:STAS domain-containing protein n=1 Tax=Streptomyces sp. BA2 TaxID=436595 RepID=UPI0013265698|nr:STAS domain-containing protein [Streptomyces sp. BA2]MWA08312.1 STAS domain-containing protein [Streptomyces sp. BA2]
MRHGSKPRLVVRQVMVGRSVVVIGLAGELDPNTAMLLREAILQVAVRPGVRRRLLLDLSTLTRCGNAGLYTLLGVCQALDAVGRHGGHHRDRRRGPHDAIHRAGLQDLPHGP